MIQFPDLSGLRPTPDRVRETLFNWLGQDLTGKHCLDLYAGSGALGFEALSRGAASVTMVERAVRGMMPKTKLGRAMMKKLKVYAGAEHPHAAQQPVPLGTHGL